MRVTGSKIKSFFENEHTIFGWEFFILLAVTMMIIRVIK